MKKFLEFLFNTVVFRISLFIFTNSDAIRQFACTLKYSNELALFACMATIVVACGSLFFMLVSILNISVILKEFYTYVRKEMGIIKTDN